MSERRGEKMGTIDISPGKIHILAFPLPAKGHINPLLHLCNRLVSKGFKVTLITTVSTLRDVKKKTTGLIDIESISDGMYENPPVDAEEYFKRLRLSATPALVELIQKYKRSDCPPKVLVYDSTMPWVLDLAHEQGLRGASFFTQSCSVCAIYYHMLQGTIQKPLKEPTVSVPLLPPLESNDLPDFDYFIDGNQAVKKLLLDQFLNIDEVDYILFNSFDKLEEVANWMANKWPILTIGPTAPSMFLENQLKTEKEDGNYLFETNTDTCLKWLDQRETGSVLYVSFGSVATLGEEQMKEVAEALVGSNCHFLWVVRAEEEGKLPKDFKSETSEKGLIINWCPQLDVLAHRAVACFMTHCGWNSTLEALSSGVPMIAVPQWVDQTTNAKCIADIWKAGIRVKINEKGIVTREEFNRCINEVTETERGKELKRNAMKWKELAKEAVSEGGSSDRNIEELVSTLYM